LGVQVCFYQKEQQKTSLKRVKLM